MGIRLGASRVQFAAIDAATSGDNTLVSGSAGNQIIVLNYLLVSGGTVNATFSDGTTPFSGAIPLVANGGASFPGDVDSPAFKVTEGEDLILELSGAVQVSGHLAYLVVPV